MNEFELDVAKRVNELEVTTSTLLDRTNAISSLQIQQGDRFDGQFRELALKLDNLNEKQNKSEKADWQTLGLFGGLLLSLITAVGVLAFRPFAEDINQIRARQSELLAGEKEQLKEVGRMEVLVEQHQKGFESLDDILQREMRTLDQVLQNEMRQLISVEAGKIDHVNERLNALNERVTRHQSDAHPHSALRELEALRGEVKAIQANRFTPQNYIELQEKNKPSH